MPIPTSKSRTGVYPSTSLENMQLSLFSEVTEAIPVDNLETESINASNGRPDTARTPNSGTLEQVPAEDGRDAGGAESATAGDLRGAGIDGQPPLRTDGSPEDGLPDRLGTDDERVGLSS